VTIELATSPYLPFFSPLRRRPRLFRYAYSPSTLSLCGSLPRGLLSASEQKTSTSFFLLLPSQRRSQFSFLSVRSASECDWRSPLFCLWRQYFSFPLFFPFFIPHSLFLFLLSFRCSAKKIEPPFLPKKTRRIRSISFFPLSLSLKLFIRPADEPFVFLTGCNRGRIDPPSLSASLFLSPSIIYYFF